MNCGQKSVVSRNLRGQTFPWKDFRSVVLHFDFFSSECENCGARSYKKSDFEVLDELLAKSLHADVKKFIGEIAYRRSCSQRNLSAVLGISPQYLAEIKSGRKTPSATVFNLLKVLYGSSDSYKLLSPELSNIDKIFEFNNVYDIQNQKKVVERVKFRQAVAKIGNM